MRGQGLVHTALLGHDRHRTGGRFQENDLSDEDSTETDSRGHQAEDEVKGTEHHRGETSFALQQVMDGNLSRRLLCVVDSLSGVAVWSQENKTKRMASSGLKSQR